MESRVDGRMNQNSDAQLINLARGGYNTVIYGHKINVHYIIPHLPVVKQVHCQIPSSELACCSCQPEQWNRTVVDLVTWFSKTLT